MNTVQDASLDHTLSNFIECGVNSSNLFRHNVRCAIAATQEAIGFVIANDLLLRRIESQRTAEAVRGIGQVYECR